MPRRYATIDVFTERAFRGNPLAVVLDAQGLTVGQMQSIAAEFNYSETTFILPPRDAAHTAHVRIFTPRIEVPFAGHPNIGTAVVLAGELEAAGSPPVDSFAFEEAAGLVQIRLTRRGTTVTGAEFTAPESLAILATVSVEDAAACLSLTASEITVSMHPPQVVSVGLPWLVAEVLSREGLRRCKPNLQVHERVLPPLGIDGIFAYYSEPNTTRLHARVFAPLDATIEDPATGSAAAAAIALRASVRPEPDLELHWRVDQGVDMGRPSLLFGRTEKCAGALSRPRVSGDAITVMNGHLCSDP